MWKVIWDLLLGLFSSLLGRKKAQQTEMEKGAEVGKATTEKEHAVQALESKKQQEQAAGSFDASASTPHDFAQWLRRKNGGGDHRVP